MFTQFFFLAGLAAVAFFFLGVALLGMSMFAETEAGRLRLTRAQSLALLLLIAFAGWTAWKLQAHLEPWLGVPPPTAASSLHVAERETMTVMLLGLSLVVNSLLAAFAWIRITRPGNALRSLVWALPGLQVVLGCKDLLGALQVPEAVGFADVFSDVSGTVQVVTAISLGIVLTSWLVGQFVRRSRLRAGAVKS